MIWEGLGDLINKFRKRLLGLDSMDGMKAPSLIPRLHVPYSYLWYVASIKIEIISNVNSGLHLSSQNQMIGVTTSTYAVSAFSRRGANIAHPKT